MKILISSKGNEVSSMADNRYGRCSYFAVYNDENNTYEFHENTGASSSHGAGIAAAQIAIDKNVDVLITGALGMKAFQVIDSSNIKAYKFENSKSINEIVNDYNDGNLEQIKSAK